MKYVINIAAIIVFIFLVLWAIQFKESSAYHSFRGGLENLRQYAKNFIKARKHNISMEVSPKRKRPLTFIEHEEALRIYLPNIFEKFDSRQWRKFWDLIYEPIKEKQGSFTVKGYRTKEEIETHLKHEYPDPLGYFRQNHWFDFWSVAGVSWRGDE